MIASVTWLHFDGIVLSEISQAQKDTCMISLMWVVRVVPLIETENGKVVFRA